MPRAVASINGGSDFSEINGNVSFFDTENGVFVIAEIYNLPTGPQTCESSVFGFHIHEGEGCYGNANDEFAQTRAHYNPTGVAHPYHAGDMPPLLCSDGYAFLAFITNRFTIDEIIGKTVVIHSMRDDFTTQPSGDSGEKIACGVIGRVRR
ncbi:MAG: superoxide dismutase family protein [Clostridia bacterium]|nr:superoxide dismutase family protein [Clostridia bacterium]